MKKRSLFLALVVSTCFIKADSKHAGLFADIKKNVSEEYQSFLSEIENKWDHVVEWLEGAKKHAQTLKVAHGPALLHDKSAQKADKEIKLPNVNFDAYKKPSDDAHDVAEHALDKASKMAKDIHDTLKDHAEKIQKNLKEAGTEHNKVIKALSKAKADKKHVVKAKADKTKTDKKETPKKEAKKKDSKADMKK